MAKVVLTPEQKEQNKFNGGKRAQFVRQHCYLWMEKHQGEKLKQFEAAAEKEYPLIGERKPEFKPVASLLD